MHFSNEKIDLDAKTSNGSLGSYGDSQFRKRLMEILRSPYNANEYEYLLHEVSRRRQTERNRELRNGTKSYTLDSVAKSYLDQHHGKFIMTNTMVSYILIVLFMVD